MTLKALRPGGLVVRRLVYGLVIVADVARVFCGFGIKGRCRTGSWHRHPSAFSLRKALVDATSAHQLVPTSNWLPSLHGACVRYTK